MSKLNINAFEFVPGRSFKIPTPSQPPSEPAQSPLQPLERPEQTDAPKPAPTISLNIGGSKPPQPVPEPPLESMPKPSTESKEASNLTPAPAAAPPKQPSSTQSSAPPTSTPSPAPSTKAYNFTAGKAKTDTDAIAQEVHKVVDSEVIGDLFGKQHLNIVFIGHVDAGKSTMGGNILYLTGMVDKRTMEKYEREAKEAGRESWYLSWALDSTAQERSKVRKN